jgi:hypothetical protein
VIPLEDLPALTADEIGRVIGGDLQSRVRVCVLAPASIGQDVFPGDLGGSQEDLRQLLYFMKGSTRGSAVGFSGYKERQATYNCAGRT